MTVDELNLADGRITAINGHSGEVRVCCLDWQEKTIILSFNEVIGLTAYSPENVDLSHLSASTEHPAISAALAVAEEDPTNQHCYEFVSAWSGQSVLTIVAQHLDIVQSP